MISYATKTVLLHWNYSYRLPLYYSIRKEARGTRRKKKKYILFISLDDDDEEKEKELAGKASDHLQACPGCPPACPSPGPTLQRPARSGIRRRANLDVPTTSYLSRFLLLPLPSSLAPPRPPPPPPHRRLAASLVARPASSPPRPPLSIPCSQPLPSTSSVDPLRARPAAVGLAVSGSSRRCVPALQRAGSSGAEGLPPAARSEEQARGTIYWWVRGIHPSVPETSGPPKSKSKCAHQSGSYRNPFRNRSEVRNRWGWVARSFPRLLLSTFRMLHRGRHLLVKPHHICSVGIASSSLRSRSD